MTFGGVLVLSDMTNKPTKDEKERDKVLERMLKTPPKPKTDKNKESKDKKKN